jgi:hypothetical protein
MANAAWRQFNSLSSCFHYGRTLTSLNNFDFLQVSSVANQFFVLLFHNFTAIMDEKQHRRSHKHKSSRRMEDDLNRSSFRTSGDSAGRPPPEKVPRTSGADPCVPPRGDEPYFQREASAQPQTGNESSHGAIPVILNSQVPPQEGFAAPVASVPARGQLHDGSNADE